MPPAPRSPDDWLPSHWMPPSPHRERVVEMLRRGRAHIEPRGHGVPPLFVYEDGGVIELPRVRLVDDRLVADESAEATTQTTKHVDVCGSIDELRRLLDEDPAVLQRDPPRLQRLIAEAERQLGHMRERLEAYQTAADEVARLLERMQAIQGPAFEPAEQAAAVLQDLLAAGHEPTPERVAEVVTLAEQMRDVANAAEQALYPSRDATILLGALYEGLRGARDWSQRLSELQAQEAADASPHGNRGGKHGVPDSVRPQSSV